MHRASMPVRIIALFCALALFLIAGGGALAVADDYLARDVLPEGATVAGVDVSGLTREQARTLVEAQVVEPLTEPVTVTHGNRSFTLDAASMISVDVEGMVETAFDPRETAVLPYRVLDRALGTPTGGDVEIVLSLDSEKIARWLDEVAASVDTTPSDATMTVDVDKLIIIPSRVGETVDCAKTVQSLEDALTRGAKRVGLAVIYTQPEITDEDLDTAILVDLSERRLYLYENGKLAEEYGVAVGAPGYSTPRGNFKIVQKRYMPTWSNPGSAWAAGMPQTIGPGPSNPLGTRALNLDASGIRIHGTSNDASIGTAASHGCMRMHRWDIEDLYDRVEVGTSVFIVK
ncbi:MAG: L,D-transpeptidase/peptidoglycan binding protein [Coriobacteriia bacterium]|nr:L,D-transpeptidase/peptidoglycan binding protein [Coriobacteriia bacterium]